MLFVEVQGVADGFKVQQQEESLTDLARKTFERRQQFVVAPNANRPSMMAQQNDGQPVAVRVGGMVAHAYPVRFLTGQEWEHVEAIWAKLAELPELPR